MLIKDILFDSFKELKPVLKNWKLTIVTLITLFIQFSFAKFQAFNLKFVLLSIFIGLFSVVYQYIAIATSINTEEKNLYDLFEVEKFSVGISLLNFIISSFRIFILFIILLILIPNLNLISLLSLNIIFPAINPIAYISIILLILIIPVVRYYFFVPLAILGNVFNPLKYSWELSQGKFLKLILIMLCTIIFSSQNLLIGIIIKNSNYLILTLYAFLTVISIYINTLISINSLYYFINKDSLNDEKSSNIKAI